MTTAARSGAVLVGVGEFADPKLRAVPAAVNSVRAMRGMLTNPDLCGWSDELVIDMVNPVNAGRTAVTLRDHVRRIDDVLLVYYAGHGQLTETGSLCLAMSDTIEDAPEFTGLSYRWLAVALRESPARVKITILDCCFSGQALQALSGSGGQIADLAHIRGAFTLTATTSNESAHVVPLEEQGDKPTTFTGELVGLVEEGLPEGRTELTIGDLYPVLRYRLMSQGYPRPDQRGSDTVFRYVFTRNAAMRVPADRKTQARRERRLSAALPAAPDVELPPVLSDRFTVESEIPSRRGTRVLVAQEKASGDVRLLKLRPRRRRPMGNVADEVVSLSQRSDGGRHLVTLYEAGLAGETWFEVQEYCFHQSLREVVDTGHELDVATGARELGQALAFLEPRLFVVDLNPGNLFVRSLRPLNLVVGDIRLMRSSAEGMSLRSRPSSSAYLPPEAGQNLLTPAWAWWSAGMVIAEVALGRHPLADDDGKLPPERDLLDRVRYTPIDLRGIADVRVRRLCDGLLRRDRRRRWGRAKVLRWIAGASVG